MQTLPEHVILFVVDGMRPDTVSPARTPVINGLMQRGTYSLAARSVMPSVTLPVHMSMFHGAPPDAHTVTSNDWHPTPGDALPGIVDLAREARRRTAAFYTWEPLRDLWRPGAMTYSSFINIYGPDGLESDREIARLAADYLTSVRPEFTFVYLGLVDEIGHRYGWLSAEYLAAVAGADAAIGHVLERLEGAGLLARTACLVLADHGGHDHGHGLDIPEDMTIPWVLAGPGIRRGSELSVPVNVTDTAPTLASLLGLPIPLVWSGRVVAEAMES